MNQADLKRAKALSAQLKGVGTKSKIAKKYKPVRSFTYKSGPLPFGKELLSPYAKTLAVKSLELRKPEVKIVEKPFYYGEPGKKGDKGDRGDAGRDGRDGKDGHSPIKGKDFLTEQEINAIKEEIKHSIVPEEHEEKELEVNEELVKKIIAIMHTLPESEKLEVSQGIRNAQSFIYGGTKYKMAEMMHGGGSSTGGSSTPLIPTGDVNAMNAVFGVVSEPSSVVADGITYFDGAGYTYASLTITMDIPPSQYIRYYA